ncbi:MAG: hypothetical protein Q9227_008422 [Pyrenula ochraceoflavens]
MSLNGLDSSAVLEAYQAALAEPGGWFLLKYISRDTVELLNRGNGGVADVRSTIEQYPDKSPLYGFVQYRRRKIVLSYIPEGTSRLLQARVTVHFQSVLEKFSPHDTTFSLTTPTDITETALSSACMLHTSAGSFTSSSSSLRRRRLGEITEDAEESRIENDTPASAQNTKEASFPQATVFRSDTIPTVEINGPSRPQSPTRKEPEITPSQPEPAPINVENALSKPDTSVETTEVPIDKSPLPSAAVHPNETPFQEIDPGDSYQRYLEELSKSGQEPRKSTQSARPSAIDIEKASLYSGYSGYRAKRKLGPRPSLDQQGRPRTSGYAQLRSGEPRPVSTLPQSIRFSTRPVSQAPPIANHQLPLPRSPGSVASSATATAVQSVTQDSAHPPPPSPTSTIGHISSFYRPPLFENTSSQTVPLAPKTSNITPEKKRLMRALQMRKKQIAQSQREREEQHSAIVPNQMSEQINFHSLEDKENIANPSNQQSNRNHPDSAYMRHGSNKSTESDPLSSPISTADTSEATSSTKGSSFTEFADHLRDEKDTQEHNMEIESELKSISEKPSPVIETWDEDIGNARLSEAPTTPNTVVATPNISSKRSLSSDTTPTPPSTESPRSSRRPNLSIYIDKPKHDSVGSDARSYTTDSIKASSSERRIKGQSLADSSDKKTNSMISNISDDEAFMEELQSAKVEEAKPITVARSPATPIFPKGAQDFRTLSNETQTNGLHPVDSALPTPKADGAKPNVADKPASSQAHIEDKEPKPEDVQTPESMKPSVEDSDSRLNSIRTYGSSQSRLDEKRSPFPRTVSAESASEITQAKPQALRNVSGRSLPQWPPTSEASAPMQVRKVSVSSGISKRIKALEMFSGKDSSSTPPPTQPNSNHSSPSKSWKSRKSWMPNQQPPNTNTATPPPSQLPYPSPEATPELKKVTLRPTKMHFPVTKSKKEPEKPPAEKPAKTISVTARIVRENDDGDISPRDTTPATSGLNLKRSELTVEEKEPKLEASALPPPAIDTNLTASPIEVTPIKSPGGFSTKSKKEKHRRSFTASISSKLPSADNMSSRLSLSSITRPKIGELSLARSTSDSSSLIDAFEERDKKESRRSRIMRRMSSLASPSKRSSASSPGAQSIPKADSYGPMTIAEDSEAGNESQSQAGPSHVVDIGDVNVQFPDSLLWKHRFMRIDDQGYLILTPSTMESNTRSVSRRFHLSEFKRPTIPDLERQELPHSILLDFHDGSYLQCACESRYAQMQALTSLVDAHTAYHQLHT